MGSNPTPVTNNNLKLQNHLTNVNKYGIILIVGCDIILIGACVLPFNIS